MFKVGELGRGFASLRLSGGGLEASGAWEEDSSSDSRLMFSWGLQVKSRGEEEEVEVQEEGGGGHCLVEVGAHKWERVRL